MSSSVSLEVERAELLFGNLDTNSDGDITEEEFVKNCFKDKDLCDTLATTQGIEMEVKDDEKTLNVLVPRQSLAVENRITTRRRYSDLCLRKKLFLKQYN